MKYQITKQRDNKGKVFYKAYIEKTKKRFWSRKKYKVMESLDYCLWDNGDGAWYDCTFDSIEEAKRRLIIKIGVLSKEEVVVEYGKSEDLAKEVIPNPRPNPRPNPEAKGFPAAPNPPPPPLPPKKCLKGDQ